MLVWVRLKTLYNLEQTRVSVVEMWPGEQHRSSALTSANIEHSLWSAANITRGTKARAVFRREGGPVRDKSECVHAEMLDSLLVLYGQGPADILVEYMEYLILFHVWWKEASISSMNPVASPLITSILLVIIP